MSMALREIAVAPIQLSAIERPPAALRLAAISRIAGSQETHSILKESIRRRASRAETSPSSLQIMYKISIRLIKESNSRFCPFFARVRRVSTRSAPGSLPRKARSADVSSTKRFFSAIFFAPVPLSFRQEPFGHALGSRSSKRGHWIVRQRYDPRRGSFDDPFQSGMGTNPKLSSNLRRN